MILYLKVANPVESVVPVPLVTPPFELVIVTITVAPAIPLLELSFTLTVMVAHDFRI